MDSNTSFAIMMIFFIIFFIFLMYFIYIELNARIIFMEETSKSLRVISDAAIHVCEPRKTSEDVTVC